MKVGQRVRLARMPRIAMQISALQAAHIELGAEGEVTVLYGDGKIEVKFDEVDSPLDVQADCFDVIVI